MICLVGAHIDDPFTLSIEVSRIHNFLHARLNQFSLWPKSQFLKLLFSGSETPWFARYGQKEVFLLSLIFANALVLTVSTYGSRITGTK